MRDMVYQGTVFDPPLWDVFFADARGAIVASGFSEIVSPTTSTRAGASSENCSDTDAFAQI
eukprot:8560595-Alexandrium_andersonii.AAC.1